MDTDTAAVPAASSAAASYYPVSSQDIR